MSEVKVIQSKDKILPLQAALNYHTLDMSEYFEKLHDLMLTFNKDGSNSINKFDLEFPKNFTYFQMGTDLPGLHFLQFMIRFAGYKKVLEIGTFMGVSAMHLADSANDVHVTTVEVGQEFYEIAKRNIEKNGYSEQITVLHADANRLTQVLDADAKFDFISIDGDKGNYCNLFKMLLPYLNPKGLIIIDDALFHGDVLNKEVQTDKGRGVCEVLDEVAQRADVEGFLLPLGNGKLLVRKT